MHCDEANDLTFCMVAYKDGKQNSNNLDKAFIINGFSNLEDASVTFKKHDSSKCHDRHSDKIFCLFGLRLYVPVNNFSVMSGQSHRFMGITSTFLGGIDKNEQSDYLTCIQRKNRHSRLEGSKLLFNL